MTAVPLDVRISLLRQYGSFTQAYSATFQPGLRHFGDEHGFIAYKKVGKTAMVLGDPVAPAFLTGHLIGDFVKDHPDSAFWQISHPVASALAGHGFLINELGYETRLDLATYTLAGQRRRNLRKAAQRMAKLGYSIRECAISHLDAGAVIAVSAAWRRTRTVRNREAAFLTRPISIERDDDVRWFCAHTGEKDMVGFCVCDPIYEAGDIIGYSTASRQLPDANAMIGHALKRHAIEVFQSEGRRWLTLGLSPADGIEDRDFNRDWACRRLLRFAYTNGLFNRFVYPLQGHAAHKRQFGGTTYQTYAAISARPALLRLIKLLRACEIF